MKALIVGQAPARSGDGTPFSGPSGRRLCQLLEVPSLDELRQWFDLDNLITHQLPQRSDGRGDMFHVKRAEDRAKEIIQNSPSGRIIVACGRQVWAAFGCDLSIPWFGRMVRANPRGEPVELRLFPHPSGVSHFWNEPENVQRARDALKAIAFCALMMRRDAPSQCSQRLPSLSENVSGRAPCAHRSEP